MIRTLLRREIIEPTEDGYHITVPLIAYYVRSQRQPVVANAHILYDQRITTRSPPLAFGRGKPFATVRCAL
jgi:hypothetical protein